MHYYDFIFTVLFCWLQFHESNFNETAAIIACRQSFSCSYSYEQMRLPNGSIQWVKTTDNCNKTYWMFTLSFPIKQPLKTDSIGLIPDVKLWRTVLHKFNSWIPYANWVPQVDPVSTLFEEFSTLWFSLNEKTTESFDFN